MSLKNIDNLEKKLLQEIEAKGQNTFMYRLHYEGILECEKLDSFLDNCNKVFDFYYSNGKTNNYIKIAREVIIIFEHFLFLLYCHKDKKDVYMIKNYNKIDKDKLSDYYFIMRELTDKIIF